MPAELITTHTSAVTDDQIDALGHMNVRWYAHNAFAATSALTARLGIGAVPVTAAYTRHHRERMNGDRLVTRSGIVAGGHLRLLHELRNVADGELAATFLHELDHPAVEAPTVDLPDHARPRSIDLDGEAVARAPTLDEALESGLAARHPRRIDDADTFGAATVPAWSAQSLFWGGDPIDGSNEWVRTGPDGRRIASATVESRLSILELPADGVRIQSFGAPTAIAEKVTQTVHWAFDVTTGALLGVLEAVNVVIDLDARCAIPVPDDERRRTLDRLRPDLAPR